MLLRCLIIIDDFQTRRIIKIVGIFLLLLRFADWPYELTTYTDLFQNTNGGDHVDVDAADVNICWVTWTSGVLILNFIGDILPSLFLGGTFVYKLSVFWGPRTDIGRFLLQVAKTH
ncbi:hypothetical protein BC937DRAFT_94189 [Endogone sp. FLAS-F59071]|nr:hypothetical protein BC937DRAFT_94189 [Endogone sp. FLAS-F59071]|eukprot:RUS14204.1 hypothetical protein BC937DRAFT_94189 [Endogone sp. FLAS-F59071]